MICGQHGCTERARYRFTWPGSPESVICERHVHQLRGIADAIGMPTLQIIDMDSADEVMLRAARKLRESAAG